MTIAKSADTDYKKERVLITQNPLLNYQPTGQYTDQPLLNKEKGGVVRVSLLVADRNIGPISTHSGAVTGHQGFQLAISQ